MDYKKISISGFFSKISNEEKARELLWKCRFGKKGFKCPHCQCQNFFHIHTRPEVRQCKSCKQQIRLRAGTIMHRSHLPILTWLRAIYLITSGKRGISALELQRHLGLTRYETALNLTKKIRRALWQRDKDQKLKGVVELDGTAFGKRARNNQERVLVAVEAKEFIGKNGNICQKAGLAKVYMGRETRKETRKFFEEALEKGSKLKTDGAKAYIHNRPLGYYFDSRDMLANPNRLDEHLPWVSRFIANAKTWILGTHHGVRAKYLNYYLAEFVYRFNRRHDAQGLFSRALKACCAANPITIHALNG